MKTMTCRQLGGPCDLALSGATADEIIKAQDAHLKAVVALGDTAFATIVVVAQVSATVYRRAIVRTGRRLKLRDLLGTAS